MGIQAGDEAGIPGADEWQHREGLRRGWTDLPAGQLLCLGGDGQAATGLVSISGCNSCSELGVSMRGAPQAQEGKRIWTPGNCL